MKITLRQNEIINEYEKTVLNIPVIVSNVLAAYNRELLLVTPTADDVIH